MSKNWRKIKSWKVGQSDGSAENYTLYEDEATGSFVIQNDFGNITIDMERMSAYEFLKRASQEIESVLEDELIDDDWSYAFDNNDCDSSGTKAGI